MIHMQNTKHAIMVAPQTVGTTAVSGYVDTLNADYVTVTMDCATAAAADVFTALVLQHGDTTSAFTNISGYIGGTDFSIPAPNTSTPDTIRFHLDRNKTQLKRYVNISITGDATTRTCSVSADLSRLNATPTSASEAGCTTLVTV